MLSRIPRGQRVPIGDEEVALILVLQFDPILEGAVIVAEMQLSGRAHPRQHASILYESAHPIPNALIS